MIDLSTLKLDNLVVTEMKHNMTYTFAQEYNDPQNYYWYKEWFTKAELERVFDHARTIKGVQDIISYVDIISTDNSDS